MSYIGNQPPDTGAYDVESFNGGGTSFTLKRAATVSSVLLFIDGVRQTPTDAYSVSGTSLTTTATTPSGTNNVTVMFMGDVVDIGTPSNDTVTSAKIVDGSVANADMADMAANTIKVRDANSSGVPSDKALATTEILIGDGTGFTAAALSGDVTMTNAGAVTIATDAVDIAMLSATGTADATTFLRGDNAWAAAGGGKVAQVVMGTTTTSTATTSTSYIDSTLTVDITPSATSSKVLVLGSQRLQTQSSDSNTHSRWQLLRDTTVIVPDLRWSSRASSSTDTVLDGDVSICYLDSPSTTSATTYKVQFRVNSGDQATAQNDSGTSTIIALEITT